MKMNRNAIFSVYLNLQMYLGIIKQVSNVACDFMEDEKWTEKKLQKA